jgi:MFS family permease
MAGQERVPGRLTARLGSMWRSGPMSNRDFRLLSAGQLTSTTGDSCYVIALPWLILTTHSGRSGPALLGIVLACYGVPRTILIPVGGILADKIGPRRLMLAADLVRCVLVAVLALLAARRLSSLQALGPIAAVIGAGEGLFMPASLSIMPTLLPPEELPAGNALGGAMLQGGTLVGPILGGILVATAGTTPAFAVDAVSFAVSALTLSLISASRRVAGQPPPEPVTGSPDADAAIQASTAGSSGTADSAVTADPAATASPTVWHLVRTARLLQVILAMGIAANLASGATFEVALPTLSHDRFGAGGYGALLACFAVGAMIGTLSAVRAGRFARPALAGFSAYLVQALAIAVLPFLWGLPGAAAAVLVGGLANGFGNVLFITLLQQWAPPRLLGRVMSLIMLATTGIYPLSVAVGGVLVRRLGPSPIFPIAAVLIVLPVLAALTQREMRQFGADAGG